MVRKSNLRFSEWRYRFGLGLSLRGRFSHVACSGWVKNKVSARVLHINEHNAERPKKIKLKPADASHNKLVIAKRVQ